MFVTPAPDAASPSDTKRDKIDPRRVYDLDYLHYIMQLDETFMERWPIVYPEPLSHIAKYGRNAVIDWLLDVTIGYYLNHETLHQAMNLLDRYVSTHVSEVSKNNLQLIAITSLYLACKFEEIYAPSIEDMSFVTDHCAKEDDIRAMERPILEACDYRFGRPTVLNFVNFWCHFHSLSPLISKLARFYALLTLAMARRGRRSAFAWASACIELASRQYGISNPVLHGDAECMDMIRRMDTALIDEKPWDKLRPSPMPMGPDETPLASSDPTQTPPATATDTSAEHDTSPIH